MRISKLATVTGCHIETIRYYEKIGLLPPALRAGTYRTYGDHDAARLSFVMRCRGLGFSLDETRSLLSLSNGKDSSCAAVDEVARAHLEMIESKQAELATMASELRAMLAACERETVATCQVVRTLAS